jgi:SynChlorMet cassette radical SAM/SPASM protein ScmF
MTLMRRNRHQLSGVVRLAEDLGASSVKFNLLQPTARGKGLAQSEQALSVAELVELGRFVESTPAATAGIPLYFDYPHAFRPLSRIFGPGGGGRYSCDILHILGVLADGSYALCGIGESVPELIFGHCAKDPLAEVWNRSKFLNELRCGLPWKLTGICRDCLMRNLCLGGCIAQNYYRHGHAWGSFWFCELANESNLFPESRRTPTSGPDQGLPPGRVFVDGPVTLRDGNEPGSNTVSDPGRP